MTGPSGEGQGPANSGSGGVAATLFTQDQLNHVAAEAKRTATAGYFKEAGLETPLSKEDLQAALKDANEFKKLQQGQQGDVERLTTQLGDANKKAERIPELEAVVQRQKVAAKLKLPIEMWEFVKGNSEEDITTSVTSLKGVIGQKDDDEEEHPEQPRPGTGGGRPPEPNPQQGRGGGQPPSKTMSAGADAYRAKHKKE